MTITVFLKGIVFSKILSRRIKERLYYRNIRPIVMYAYEILSSTQGDEVKLQNFERKRKIYGPVYNNDLKSFERKTNENLRQLYNKPSLPQFLIKERLEWACTTNGDSFESSHCKFHP